MASGKKGKKNRGKTLALNEFLQESPGSIPTKPIRKSTTSWADEIDDYDGADAKNVNMVLPTAPKASRDYEDIANNVPKEPPFVAYMSNLPYDVEDDEIRELFKNMTIVSMRIPSDDRTGEMPKCKGYGYVEFQEREDLMNVLVIPDPVLKNRRVRIELANTEYDRRRGGRQGMGDRMGGGGGGSDTSGDWRSNNRPEPMEDRRGGGGGGFSRDREGGGFTREGMRDSRDRDYSGFGRDRDGGFSRNRDQDDRPGAWREGDRPAREPDSDRPNRDRGFSRQNYRDSDRNSGFNRDDRDDRRGGGFNRRYDDREERNGGFTRSSNRGDKDDRESEPPSSSEPRQRPKLRLAPRTKPIESAASKPEPAAPSASIFGNAKPVDTTERERQIEEKLMKEQEERLERLRESSKDRRDPDRGGDEEGDRKDLERGRSLFKRDEEADRGSDAKGGRGPASRERRSASGENSYKPPSLRSDYKSPDNKKRSEKPDRSKREEKREKPEKEMPKFQEPKPPNFTASNKFALLPDDDDDDDSD